MLILGLEQRVREGQSRDKFESMFQAADSDGDRVLTRMNFLHMSRSATRSTPPAPVPAPNVTARSQWVDERLGQLDKEGHS